MSFARFLSRTAVAALAVRALPVRKGALAQAAPPAAKDKPEPPSASAPPVPARRGPRPGDVQRVFVIKYVDAGRMARVLSVFPAEISSAVVGEVQALAVSA